MSESIVSLLLYIAVLVIIFWVLYQLLMWLLLRGLPSSQALRNKKIEADAAYVKHLISHHEIQKKAGNVSEADQIEAELRELRIEGWYRPASAKNTDTES